MRNAPSVNYPVGRSRLAGRFIAGLWGMGAASFVTWCFQAGSSPWRTGFLATTLLLAGLAGLRAARLGQGSHLLWDGRQWKLESALHGRIRLRAAVVHLDLQSLLLVRLLTDAGAAQWVWAEHSADPCRWPSLRRALHARPAPSPRSAVASSPNT